MEFKGTNELKSKIAEMQQTIDELTKALEEASLLLEDTKSKVSKMRVEALGKEASNV